MQKIKKLFSNTQFKNGNYSAVLTVIVIAIAILLNLVIRQIPSNLTSLDMSDSLIYSVGDTTKEVISKLNKDLSIKVIVENGKMETRIEKFLNNYADLSQRITVEYIDPVLHPSVLTQYDVKEYSLVVECPDTGRVKTLSFNDIILYDTSSYSYTESGFDGEGQVTSAIDYVTSENSRKMYQLTGHGESGFSQDVNELIQKANIETESLDLLTKEIPEDCDLLMLYAPTKDLADDEKEKLITYLDSGKNMIVIPTVTKEPLENLNAFLQNYGLTFTNSYVGDKTNYYTMAKSYYNFFPTLPSSEVNQKNDSETRILLSAVGGMTELADKAENLTVEPFMTTSDQGFVMDMNTQEENADSVGSYLLGASVTKTLEGDQKAKLTVLSADSMINEQITSGYKNLNNLDEFMNILTWYFDDVSNISIPSKSLEVVNNTFINTGGWSMLYIAIIPAIVLAGGFMVWMKRRKA